MFEIADETSSQFRSLVNRAEHGEVIVITRDGKPVARIEPVRTQHDPVEARHAIQRLRDFARAHPVPGITTEEIKSWIEEGRP